MKLIRFFKWLLIISLVTIIGACAVNSKISSSVIASLKNSDHFKDGKFHNTAPQDERGFGKFMEIMGRWVTEEKVDSVPAKPVPVKTVTRKQLDALSNDAFHLIKLGHSSLLLKVYGEYWLIDPMFSERASPFNFAGPKRFHPPPITIKELPPITRVLISHNHYDHFDKASIEQLASKTREFLSPLGTDGDLKKWGVAPQKIKTFDWWQEFKTDKALLVFTPSQHFSGRGLNDRNSTLWGSWVIKTARERVYYSGDSGYFAGFKAIGDKYGPFDLTLLETGAYNTDWPDVHMFPEESVKAHLDLRGKTLLPVHNGTFDLSFHPWYEPFERVTKAAKAQGVQLTIPLVGEVFTARQQGITEPWWQALR
ncbi:MAG: MBL fold metallo-hydrolase [Thiolinea sp.]